jgi:hypothetical protein
MSYYEQELSANAFIANKDIRLQTEALLLLVGGVYEDFIRIYKK